MVTLTFDPLTLKLVQCIVRGMDTVRRTTWPRQPNSWWRQATLWHSVYIVPHTFISRMSHTVIIPAVSRRGGDIVPRAVRYVRPSSCVYVCTTLQHLCIFGLYGATLVFLKIIFTSLYLVEGLAWWDWTFTWWIDQLLSFSAWHCWLGHLTCKIVPDVIYNVFWWDVKP